MPPPGASESEDEGEGPPEGNRPEGNRPEGNGDDTGDNGDRDDPGVTLIQTITAATPITATHAAAAIHSGLCTIAPPRHRLRQGAGDRLGRSLGDPLHAPSLAISRLDPGTASPSA